MRRLCVIAVCALVSLVGDARAQALPTVYIGSLCGGVYAPPVTYVNDRTPNVSNTHISIADSDAYLWPLGSSCSAKQFAFGSRQMVDLPESGAYQVKITQSTPSAPVWTYGQALTGDYLTYKNTTEIYRRGTPQTITVDGYDGRRLAIYGGTGTDVAIVDAYGVRLEMRSFAPVMSSTDSIVSLSMYDSRLVAVIHSSATSAKSIALHDTATGTASVIAAGLTETTATVTPGFVVWSQPYGSDSALYYWTAGLPAGGELLFTPDLGFDLKHPVAFGDEIIFARRWPLANGSRKVAFLVYDMSNLSSGDSTVCEITDRGRWSDDVPLYWAIRGGLSTPYRVAGFLTNDGGNLYLGALCW